MDRISTLRFATGALLTAVLATPALAVLPSTTANGGFVAMVDKQNNFGDSRKSIVFFSTQDMSTPLFAVFSGEKIPGDHRSPNSITVDPYTGDVYFLATDADQVAGFQFNPSPQDILDGILPNTEGDYDLLKIPFQTIFNDWVTNQGQAYTTYNPGAFGHDSGGNTSNPVTLAGAVEKIGEIARPINTDFFDTHLEFVDRDTLLVIDSPLVSQVDPLNDTAANDSQVRALTRVSQTPGLATTNVTLSEGGFNQGTTESWESVVLGSVNMDFDIAGVPNGVSEVEDIAFYRDPVTGVQGLWIGESDGGVNDTVTPLNNRGDDVSFFEITNFAGTAGNGLRDFTVQGTAPRFILDDDPVLNASGNNGAHDRIFVDQQDGSLIIVESGFFDVPQDEPSIITRAITSYDNLGQIEAGAWDIGQMVVSGANDDDLAITDGRWAVYDSANNDVYFYDTDSATDGSPLPIFNHDWYKYDVDTKTTTLMSFNSDISNGLFSNGDQFTFFHILQGDLNGDGFVGLADLNIVLGNWNQNVPFGDATKGDPSGDGFVGLVDLNEVLGNWNAGTPPTDIAAIPEPASLALFTIAGLTAMGRRRVRA